MSMAVLGGSTGVLSSCVACMMFVEMLAKREPACMNLMTFSTFLFVSLEGLVVYSKFLTVRNQIPIRAYLKVVTIFFGVNVINNQALNFHVPVPLHIIFRSGSLLASLLLGVLLLKRSYTLKKYLSVMLVTVGIIMCTLATSASQKSSADVEDQSTVWFIIGVALLTIALIASAYLGVTQERLYAAYGKHPREALFYIHALSLPAFALMGQSIMSSVHSFNSSPPYVMPVLGVAVPEMWLYLLACDLMQYMCIRCVYILTAHCTSLTVTLVITLRKFVSLILSVWYFGNEFTTWHWCGAALVFAGTLLFTDWTALTAATGGTKQLLREKKTR